MPLSRFLRTPGEEMLPPVREPDEPRPGPGVPPMPEPEPGLPPGEPRPPKPGEPIPGGMNELGTHGRTGLARLLMGSVAEQVMRKSSSPVLTVTTPFPEATPVGATLQGTATV